MKYRMQFCFLCVFIALLIGAACKKSHNNTSTACRVVYFKDSVNNVSPTSGYSGPNVTSYVIAYDNSGRITSEIATGRFDNFQANFTYVNNAIVKRYVGQQFSSYAVDSVVLNSNGLISCIYGFAADTLYGIESYVYDNGQLITKIDSYTNKSLIGDTTTYTWINGNCTQITTGGYEQFSYGNYPEKSGDPSTFYNFLTYGAYTIKNKNLPISTSPKIQYNYQFDNDGNISSAQIFYNDSSAQYPTLPNTVETCFYQYQCN